MPATAPHIAPAAAEYLAQLGQQIRARRKALRINATVAAEAAGMSRVTLHRIEKGEPAVTIGAYLNGMDVLGLHLSIAANNVEAQLENPTEGWIPARVCLTDYPQLKQLAWQLRGTETLTPNEALGIYERNARHLDVTTLTTKEKNLIDALRLALGGIGGMVGQGV